VKPYLKTKTRARGIAQVLENLPSKNKAPSSNPSTTKKKKIVFHAKEKCD
jgi:hypothetical protein